MRTTRRRGPAVFTVTGFDPDDTCDASEGSAPSGYSKDEAGCQDLDLEPDGTPSCTITNTLNSATVTVHKDFSDDNDDSVSVSLTCAGDGDVDSSPKNATDEDNASGAPAVFTVTGFEPGDTCDASEGAAPAGYSKAEGGCQGLELQPDGTPSCTITNTLNSATVTVHKDFSDDNDDSVSVSLTCTGDGDVDSSPKNATDEDNASGAPAVFTVTGFDPADTCDASEGAAPSGYAKDESGCDDLDLEPSGTPSCTITNTLRSAQITVHKDFSDDNDDSVSVSLTCTGDGDVDSSPKNATDEDNASGAPAVFTVTGFEPTDTCDASEGAAPSGYSKDESGCDDLTLDGGDECTITNTLNSATVTVHKDFSDDNDDPVSVSLTCTGDSDVDSSPKDATDEDNASGAPAVFTVTGFDPTDTCDASEGSAPSGYSKNESGCQDLDLEQGGTPSCTITNTLNTATFKVYKEYTPAGPTASSTMKLDCTDDSLDDSKQAAPGAGNEATFNLSGFDDGVPSCSITEDPVPNGYSDSYGSGCKTVTIADDGSYSCTVTNTLNTATFIVRKQYSDTNTAAVSVKLECDSGTIAGPNPKNASPSSPASFSVSGFNTGDTCDAHEMTVPAGYAENNTDCQNVPIKTDGDCTIQNVTALTLVTAGGCTFDRDTSRSLRQFPLIFTPDSGGNKLNATNPGQFFMNAAYGGSASSIRIWIPYPFVTVGTNPVKVYSGVTTTNNTKTCFAGNNLVRSQTDQISWQYSGAGANTFGNKKYIDVTVPPGGFVYVRVHLAYGLKGVAAGCTPGAQSPPTATCSSPSAGFAITGYKTYPFSFTDGPITATDTIESYNEFKKNPGIGGLVTQTGTGTPVGGAAVQIFQGTSATGTPKATVTTDADGWYMWSYKYTGKATSFTVKLPGYPTIATQTVTLKSNGYLTVNFNNLP